MRRAAWFSALAVAAWLPSLPVCAGDAPVGVRVGNHPNRGRVVFDLTAGSRYEVESGQERLVLHFSDVGRLDLSGAQRPPRNVLAVTAVEGGASITYRAGARPRVYRLGTRLVIDVEDPAIQASVASVPATRERAVPTQPAVAANVRNGARTASGRAPLEAAVKPLTVPAPRSSAVSPDAPLAVQAAPVPMLTSTDLAAPNGLAVRIVAPAGRGRSLSVSWADPPGVAVFRRGEWLVVVFDISKDLDLRALRDDAMFGRAEAQRLVDASVLRLPIAAPAVLIPRRDGNTWSFEPAHEAEAGHSMAVEADAGPPPRLSLRAASTGRAVTMADPETGLPLLVGTVAEAGQSMPQLRRMPQADLLPTMLGSAVLARSDKLTLTSLQDRFLLAGGMQGLRLGPNAGAAFDAEAVAMSRVFDFPHRSLASLQERLRAQQASVADLPPLARGRARRDAASTLLSMGLPQEAQSTLAIGFREDPRLREDAVAVALHGIAALLAGREAEARDLEVAALPRSDEAALWRAVLLASQGRGAEAARAIVMGLPLLLAYPDLLRPRILPLAAEALVEGNELTAARRLFEAAGSDRALDFALGLLKEREGNNAQALSLFDSVARGRDRLQRAKALRHGIELRLAVGEYDAGKAAAALEAALYAWRGDAEEITVRKRVAQLRSTAGDHRGAMAILQEATALAPDQAAAFRSLIQEQLVAAIQQEPPLAAVALLDSHKDLLPGGSEGEALTALLADRLSALDLPDRAASVLEQALAATSGLPRARLSTTLARVRLGEGDGQGALAALDGAVEEEVPEPLRRERRMLRARAEAGRGDLRAAEGLLRPLGGEGLGVLAGLQAAAQDWSGAADTMARIADTLPPLPTSLGEGDRLTLVRLAAFAALSGDQGRLASLRKKFAPRLSEGSLSEAFLLLTAERLQGLADLPRLQRELDFMRQLPDRLEPLRTAGLSAG